MIKQLLTIMHAAASQQGVSMEIGLGENPNELLITVRKEKATIFKNRATITYEIDGNFTDASKEEDVSHDFINSLKRSIANLGVKI